MNEHLVETGFVLADSVRRETFEDDVYAHLGALAAVEFSRDDSPAQSGTFRFSAAKYQALEQAAFEEAPRMEAQPPQPVNWSNIDALTTAFEAKLAESLSRVQGDEDYAPFLQFSAKCYENWLTYNSMYPNSNGTNPWSRAMRIMRFGRLLVVDDEGRLHRVRNASRTDDAPTVDRSATMGVLVRGASRRPVAMPVDDRFTLQALVLSLLKQNARGHANRISLNQIADGLRSMGCPMRVPMIQIRLTTPLKKAGVIGSTGKGFFFIESEADLIESYCFHRTKVQSADKIMARYQVRAREMNPDLDLRDECSRSGVVLNRGL